MVIQEWAQWNGILISHEEIWKITTAVHEAATVSSEMRDLIGLVVES